MATFPYLAPKEVLKHLLLNGYSWLLLGGCHESNDDVEALLRSFWLCYQKEHPEHKVFEHPDRLGTTFPVTVHGDGGRTQKKQPLEVFSLQPVLGLNTAASMKSMACCCDTSVMYGGTDLGAPESQCLNSKHSTYLTHFLLFAYPSKAYSQFDNLLTGFSQRFWMIWLYVAKKGLWQSLAKHFTRLALGSNWTWNGCRRLEL